MNRNGLVLLNMYNMFNESISIFLSEGETIIRPSTNKWFSATIQIINNMELHIYTYAD